ncbi:MAG: acetyl-CoA carboxylase carboxyltransferase subunit alpha [Gammaproteobacteria bacterium]|nr:acetyl-CoA carboxylase carboxyltransferase subunit alpha [Gammaproteobacteria bacterium]
MDLRFLDFEQPIAELEGKIESLRSVQDDGSANIAEEILRLEEKSKALIKNVFSTLTPWQISQLARHPQRPHLHRYLAGLFTDFEELHGDRRFGDDTAVVGGVARLEGKPVMVVGTQKGDDTKENVYRNFGMPRPEGYRKALRLMRMAERFKLPLLTFIDTPGAYPGVGAEERGQSEAIATNLFAMARLKTPVVCTVIGEGGSGGALAIGVGDRILMLEYSTYSVISPEGCASILWKSAEHAPKAAQAMGITSEDLKKLNLIDQIVAEPLGGAHRDVADTMQRVKRALLENLEALAQIPMEQLLQSRYQRLMSYGSYNE